MCLCLTTGCNANIWFIQERRSKCVTRSREMSHLSNISIPIFLCTPLSHITSKCFIFDANPITIWLRSYEGFDNAKINIKQRNFNTVFANISKSIWPTSDSFLLIMSHNIHNTSLFCLRVKMAKTI